MGVFVFRKMLKNKWLILFLTIGALLTVTMVTAIPVYSNGVMRRVLVAEMDNYQYKPMDGDYIPNSLEEAKEYNDPFNKVNREVSRYAGNFIIDVDLRGYAHNDKKTVYDIYDNAIKNDFINNIGLPILSQTTKYVVKEFHITNEKHGLNDYNYIRSFTNMEKHVDMIDGRLPSKRNDGIIEVAVMQGAIKRFGLLCGDEYVVEGKAKDYRVKLVGVFKPKTETATIFTDPNSEYERSLFVDTDVMMEEFVTAVEGEDERINSIGSMQWYYVLDYNQLNLSSLKKVYKTSEDMKSYFANYDNVTFNIPMLMVLNDYFDKQESLNITLAVIETPILVLLCLLIFMLSSLLIEFDRNEISVLRSRGAGRGRIFGIYLAESSIIALIALVVGVPLAFLVCKMLGVPDGFLGFAQRTAIDVQWSFSVIIYALIAALVIIITISLPAYFASKTDITQLKVMRSRRTKSGGWKRYWVDMALLVVAAIGYFTYSQRQAAVVGEGAENVPVSPIVFISVIAFIIGGAMLFVRLYPYLIMLIFKLAKKRMSPQAFCAFSQVGRGKGKMSFIMVFMMVAVAVSLFNANSARSINTSLDDVVRYSRGADMTLMADWTEGNEYGLTTGDPAHDKLDIKEPPYSTFEHLDAADSATKVYTSKTASIRSGTKTQQNIHLMAIEPYNFGQVVPVRSELLNHRYNDYLNAMTADRESILVSKALAEKLACVEGDMLYIIEGQGALIQSKVVGIIDYWPTINPKEVPEFVIAPYSNVFKNKTVKPYEVWLKLAPSATADDAIRELKEKDIPLLYSNNVADMIALDSRSAMRMGTNGILTLGFMVTVAAFAIGFLLYWVLSIKGRTLQFGILRSMGLSKIRLSWMLVYEQIMITGAPIFASIFLGGVAGMLFIPFYQVAYSGADQIPPFTLIMNASDYIRIYLILASILVISFAILRYITNKTNINAAIKLGED